jgi:hypothetical protein
MRARLREVPTRLDDNAVERIINAVGKRTPRQPNTKRRKEKLKEELNFERVHFASFDMVGKKAENYRELIETTPLNQFLGSDLARIYEKHFGKPAGRSRPSDGNAPPSGPYLDFALAVMGEFGQNISPDTVDSALKVIRRRQKFRKLNDLTP